MPDKANSAGAIMFNRYLRPLFFLVALFAGKVHADGVLIASGLRADMVHDAKRGLIYISAGNAVQRYDIQSGAMLTPITLGGALGGIDLSPDGNTLVVADNTGSTTSVWVHLVSLDTLQDSKVSVAKAFSENGTFTAVYGADGNVYTTSTFAGSGWVPMRKLNTSSKTWTTLASVRQNTMLAASGDGETIAFAEANSSDGPWGVYDVPTGYIVRREGYSNGTSWFNYEIATNRWGDQFTIPTYGGAFVYGSAYQKLATLGVYASGRPVGVAYHPVESEIYFPWANSSLVRVYNASTTTEVRSYDFVETFANYINGPFGAGRTKLSRDGSLLMVSVNSGVRFVQMYAPLTAAAVAVTTTAGTAKAVALKGSIGNGGALSYSIAHAPSHGSISLSGATATYTPAAGFQGSDSFVYRVAYGRALQEATVNVSVLPPNRSPIAVDDKAVTHHKPVLIPVLANDRDPDGDTLTITMVTSPSSGLATISGSSILFTPGKNGVRPASFRYSISDGHGGSASATVNIDKK